MKTRMSLYRPRPLVVEFPAPKRRRRNRASLFIVGAMVLFVAAVALVLVCGGH